MPTFQTYNVTPILPAALEPLREMSFNLWWTWEPAARRLFRHLDPDLWNRTNHNPVRMLQLSRQSRLEELSQDKTFLRELKQVFEEFEKYLGRHDTYGKTGVASAIKNPIAYFSAEFGFHESIPNYSGGLGILAGDHCKSASDLDLNFVAIGLLYRHGYFKQEIDKDGVQHAVSLNQNFHHLPIREVRQGDNNLLISVQILDRDVHAGSRRQRRVPARDDEALLRLFRGAARDFVRRIVAVWPGERESARRFQHDGACPAREPAFEWREQTPRRSEPRPLERRLGWRPWPRSSDHQHHQRRAYKNVDGAGVLRALRQVSGRLGRTPYRRGFLAARDRHSRRAALGDASEIEAAFDRIRS